MEQSIYAGIVLSLLEKYADPLLKRITRRIKAGWEKFKIDFDFAFTEYYTNASAKYSYVKTILYRAEPQYIYNFFEIPKIRMQNKESFKVDNVQSILDVSHFTIIQGTGGIGKSTLMKHLFLSALEQKDCIPVFVELKSINDKADYTIEEVVFEQLSTNGCSFSDEYLDYALKSGCFLFLFDGYDEIVTEKREHFFNLLSAFCDLYGNNHFIISSRPFSEFIELQRFSILETMPFSLDQAISMISKLSFDIDIKDRFIAALKEGLYETHKSFASNPLLLSIMLLTFDNYAKIPEKLHLFYANAFETLYEKHDATKGGYRREIQCNLPYDSFRKVFAKFCFTSYFQGKFEFSRDDLLAILEKAKTTDLYFDTNLYLNDLMNSLCVIYKDGINYRFSHRSFQEYFTACFLKELSDENMERIGRKLIEKDPWRAIHDNVFSMLRDMAEDRFDSNILLPLVEELEEGHDFADRYDFYFDHLVRDIEFSNRHKHREDDNCHLILGIKNNDNNLWIIDRFSYPYVRAKQKTIATVDADNELIEYLQKNGYQEDFEVSQEIIRKDKTMYMLLKKSWIGVEIETLAQLKYLLEEKKNRLFADLEVLLI